ncbi:MAG: enoyl-CoA hydratase/isomerase family protein [Deltaproteobacteria bacterium]
MTEAGESPGSRSADVLEVEKTGRIAHVRLNRPAALNAANAALHRRLAEVWAELATDSSLHAVVLSGAGKAFCAGGDLGLIEEMAEDAAVRTATLEEGGRMVREMIAFPLPIVAAVQGAAVGLGCSLASLSDIVVMEESAYLADPHVSVGLVAGDGGAVVWPLLMSLQRAKYYLLTGERIPAATAKELGLANEVVADGGAAARAVELAEIFASKPRQAMIDTKKAVNMHLQRAANGVLEFALAAEAVSSASPEHREIVARMRARANQRR